MPKAVAILLALVLAFALAACEKGDRVTSIEPNYGNISGNDDAVIHGRGFKPGMTVHFGSYQAKSVVIDTSRRIRVKTPSGAEGAVDVIVTSEDGKTMGLKGGFTYRRESN